MNKTAFKTLVEQCIFEVFQEAELYEPTTGEFAPGPRDRTEPSHSPGEDSKIPGRFFDMGKIKLEGGLDRKTAEDIANRVWYIESTELGKDGVWNFRTRGRRYCCAVGLYQGQPAILSKTTTSGRVNFLVGDEIYRNYPSGEGKLKEDQQWKDTFGKKMPGEYTVENNDVVIHAPKKVKIKLKS
jgi:hypothetical protein